MDKNNARRFMEGHWKWIDRGFAEDVFVLTGSLGEHRASDATIVGNTSLSDHHDRVIHHPFVSGNALNAEIFAMAPSVIDACLSLSSMYIPSVSQGQYGAL